MKRILSEPLLHFFVLGVLLYISVSFIRSKSERESYEIDVNGDRVALLIGNYKNQMGSFPNPQQINVMINNYIK